MKNIKWLFWSLFFGITLLSCQKESTNNDTPGKNEFVQFNYGITQLPIDERFGEAQDKGIIQNTHLIPEASGLAVSRLNPGRIFTHNDSGHANRLYCIGENGEYYGFFWVWGTANRDWEDMCIGPGPTDGISYVYIGDIGDNNAVYNEIIISRFPEPQFNATDSAFALSIPAELVERIILRYPDGPRDAEALMIDPWTKDLYIVTKRESRSSLYRAAYPQSTTEITEMEKLAEFPFNRALAGDISSDGKQIVIKTDYKLYYWQRNENQSIVEALAEQPVLLPYKVEPQGEAFGWTLDGNGYYTLSEKSGPVEPVLYYYAKK